MIYEGIGATKKWEHLESYGPKFVENVVQAISRDLMMNRIDCSCYIANSSSQSTSPSVLHLQKTPLACGVPFFSFLQYLLLEEVPLLI